MIHPAMVILMGCPANLLDSPPRDGPLPLPGAIVILSHTALRAPSGMKRDDDCKFRAVIGGEVGDPIGAMEPVPESDPESRKHRVLLRGPMLALMERDIQIF